MGSGIDGWEPDGPTGSEAPSVPPRDGPAARSDGAGAATAPAAAAHPTPPRRARWSAAALVVVALVASGVAVQQRVVADRWRDRAELVAAQRDDAIGRTDALQRQLEEVVDLQATTEAELSTLTDRLAALAGEKADAEDRAVVSAAERDALRRVAQQVATAVSGLDACIVALLEVRASSVDAFNRLGRGEQVDVAPLNAQSAETIARCNAARQAAAAAGSAAGAL